MIKALTYIGLFVFITAGCALLYRVQPYSIRFEHERAGEVNKDAGRPTPTPTPFGPVPNVVVVAAPPPAIPATATPTPALATNKVVKRKPKSPSAVRKLKSKWVAPEVQPFSLENLFNVR